MGCKHRYVRVMPLLMTQNKKLFRLSKSHNIWIYLHKKFFSDRIVAPAWNLKTSKAWTEVNNGDKKALFGVIGRLHREYTWSDENVSGRVGPPTWHGGADFIVPTHRWDPGARGGRANTWNWSKKTKTLVPLLKLHSWYTSGTGANISFPSY